MKKLYIITFYADGSDIDRDVEWFWAESEDQATKMFWEFIKDLERDEDSAEIIDVYEIEVPKEVLESYKHDQ